MSVPVPLLSATATMYAIANYDVRMPKRTTIEIDEELLARAKRALGHGTTRATVEDALRRAADAAEGERADWAARQSRFFDGLAARIDISLLRSEQMWRQ
jgi:Arc/MetJ family transcription regulator